MENQFYRNIKPERLLKKIAKRASKNKKRTIVIFILLLLFLYLLFDNKGIIARINLELEKDKWEEQIKLDSLQTKQMQDQIKAIQKDNKTIEKIAREKYGMKRKGETVYKVKNDK